MLAQSSTRTRFWYVRIGGAFLQHFAGGFHWPVRVPAAWLGCEEREPPMDQNLRYVISAKNGDEFPMDRADFRAYFYWKENGSELERSFSIEELEAHIAECKARGAPTDMLEAALKRLRQINNSMA